MTNHIFCLAGDLFKLKLSIRNVLQSQWVKRSNATSNSISISRQTYSEAWTAQYFNTLDKTTAARWIDRSYALSVVVRATERPIERSCVWVFLYFTIRVSPCGARAIYARGFKLSNFQLVRWRWGSCEGVSIAKRPRSLESTSQPLGLAFAGHTRA